MKTLTDEDLIRVWEAGENLNAPERALHILRVARPEIEAEHCPMGLRDAMLLEIREALYGENLSLACDCPRCAGILEMHFSTRQFKLNHALPGQEFSMASDGLNVRFRVPAGGDLKAVAHYPDEESACRELLFRCVLSIQTVEGEGISVESLSPSQRELIARAMAERDPGAEILLDVKCPDCENIFQTLFDIAEHVWFEISGGVGRLLDEVNRLAGHYGWREVDILAMSRRRRAYYLELSGA